MLNERQNAILKLIEDKGDVSLPELCCKVPDVSAMTIRRDLIVLESEGYILRTRGGAVSLKKLTAIPTGEEDEYSRRARENMEAKNIVAQKALAFVSRNSAMFFDAGSTIMSLARMLPNDSYSIITTGANIAQELVSNTGASVMMPGGTVNKYTLSVSGSIAIDFIEKVNIEHAFMSASAFSLDSGFSVSNIYEAELKNKVISKAKKSIMLLDSSKFGKDLMFTICELKNINILITDKKPPDNIIQEAKKYGVEII